MNSHRMAIREEDYPPLKVQRPFPRKEERAPVIFHGGDEIGLLDIVLWDAIADNETCRR